MLYNYWAETEEAKPESWTFDQIRCDGRAGVYRPCGIYMKGFRLVKDVQGKMFYFCENGMGSTDGSNYGKDTFYLTGESVYVEIK